MFFIFKSNFFQKPDVLENFQSRITICNMWEKIYQSPTIITSNIIIHTHTHTHAHSVKFLLLSKRFYIKGLF